MYKSRNITQKIQISQETTKMIKSKPKDYLGDAISSEDTISPQSIGHDNGYSNLDVSFDRRSSSSSVSWAEENDTETTHMVQQEYEKMEKVLQGLEDIPPYYDFEEYELWINTFPCLR